MNSLATAGGFEEITINLLSYGEKSVSIKGIGFIVEQCDDSQATIAINNPQSPQLKLARIFEYRQKEEFEKLYFTIYNPSSTGIIKLLIIKDEELKINQILEYLKLLQFGTFRLPRVNNLSAIWSVNASLTTNSTYIPTYQSAFPLYPLISSVTPLSIVSGSSYNLSIDSYTNPNSTTLQNNFISSTYLPLNQPFVQTGFQVTYQPITTATGNNIFLVSMSQPLSVYQYLNLIKWS